MSSYVVAQISINDREKYARYEAGFMDIFSRFGGQVLAVDESPILSRGIGRILGPCFCDSTTSRRLRLGIIARTTKDWQNNDGRRRLQTSPLYRGVPAGE